MIVLSNEQLTIGVLPHGAELCSIRNNTTGKEYVWQADPIYWKRHAPILFPIVGSVWENTYCHEGKVFRMGQHGFARDMDFKLIRQSETELLFRLESNEETLVKYPFSFCLEIGYRLHGNKIEVIWSVFNPSDREMYFQIGAHPAFYYPNYGEGEVLGYFALIPSENLSYTLIAEKGCVSPKTYPLILKEGMLPLNKCTFDQDALIFENSQLKEVHLLDANKQPYISLQFDAPVLGLWSPPSKNAPFICIEPWYGRCDRIHYKGEYKDKDWMQHLSGHETFQVSYTISIDQ